MSKFTHALLLLIPLFCLGGCALGPTGIFYSNTTVPLDVNFNNTPVSSDEPGVIKVNEGDVKTLDLRFALPVRFTWDSNALGEIAKAHGIKKLYFADIQRIQVLFGIWSQDVVHLYGEK